MAKNKDNKKAGKKNSEPRGATQSKNPGQAPKSGTAEEYKG